jgi:hypothetical protein
MCVCVCACVCVRCCCCFWGWSACWASSLHLSCSPEGFIALIVSFSWQHWSLLSYPLLTFLFYVWRVSSQLLSLLLRPSILVSISDRFFTPDEGDNVFGRVLGQMVLWCWPYKSFTCIKLVIKKNSNILFSHLSSRPAVVRWLLPSCHNGGSQLFV